jgi:phosphatidate cytidylyltransferase
MILQRLTNLQQRLVVSSVGVICLLVSISLSHGPLFRFIFAGLCAAVIGSALWEYYQIARMKGWQPLLKIGLIGSTLYVGAIFLRTQYPLMSMLPYIALGMTLMAAFVYYFIKGSDPFMNLAITLFGILYLTIPLSCVIEINYFPDPAIVNDGRWCLLYLLLVTKITDTGAFFVGKRIGRRQLSPYISPKKTWEGAFGGLCSAIAVSLCFYLIFTLFFDVPPFTLTLGQSIWLAILLSITAQFGDLAESLLKRDVGVKDSSDLPGLGGFLDTVDSLVFTAPLLAIFLYMPEWPKVFS